MFCGRKKKKRRAGGAESGRSTDLSTGVRTTQQTDPHGAKLGNKQNFVSLCSVVAVQLDSLVLLIKVVFSALQRPNKSTYLFDLLAIENI